ncbi:hypothetical protein THAOC_00863, partial [Thalassiosira oceanica]
FVQLATNDARRERFVDELKEGVLVHAKTTVPAETSSRYKMCRPNAPEHCLVGIPCPDDLPFDDKRHKDNIFHDGEGQLLQLLGEPQVFPKNGDDDGNVERGQAGAEIGTVRAVPPSAPLNGHVAKFALAENFVGNVDPKTLLDALKHAALKEFLSAQIRAAINCFNVVAKIQAKIQTGFLRVVRKIPNQRRHQANRVGAGDEVVFSSVVKTVSPRGPIMVTGTDVGLVSLQVAGGRWHTVSVNPGYCRRGIVAELRALAVLAGALAHVHAGAVGAKRDIFVHNPLLLALGTLAEGEKQGEE